MNITTRGVIFFTVILLTLKTPSQAASDSIVVSASVKHNIQRVIQLQDKGQEQLALSAARQALKEVEAMAGKRRADLVVCMSLLAWLEQNQGGIAEAEALYKRALVLNEKLLPADHLAVAESLAALGGFYYSQGYSEAGVNDLDLVIKAEPFLKRALEIKEKKLGVDHIDLVAVLHTLGCIGKFRDQYEKTVIYYGRELKIKEQALGSGHLEVAMIASHLGEAHAVLEQYEQARPLFLRSLKVKEEKLGREHADLSYDFSYLILIYFKKGELAIAEKMGMRMLTINAEPGDDIGELCFNLGNVGKLYQAQGEYQKAEVFFIRSVILQEKVLGKKHPDLLDAMGELLTLYHMQGKHALAEPYLAKVLAIQEKELGGDAVEVGLSLNNLAWVYAAQQKYEQAEPLYKRSLAIREKALGFNTLEVAQTLMNMAELYYALGRKKEALHYKQRSEIIQAILQ
ncbi:MAG: tetratricopeptide repeat protein [Verrucomicrobiota bacterium]